MIRNDFKESFESLNKHSEQPEAMVCQTHLDIWRQKPLYRLSDDGYYGRCMGRCSSMVEHSFRKAGVEGSSPSIGC